ncbi:MAG: abortive infection protein [Pedosphaera sp.]|nr:abortive infection protein [Pedosphaera sp.]
MLSGKPWCRDRIFRLSAVVFFCLLVTAATGKEKTDDNSLLDLILRSLSLHGPILLGTAVFLRASGMSWNRAFGFNVPPVGRAIMLGLAGTIVFLPVGWALQNLSLKLLTWYHVATPPQEAVNEINKAGSPANLVYLSVFAVVIAPLAEEILFRGVIFALFKKIGYPRIAFWGSALAFAAMHLTVSIFLPLFVFGLVLAWLYDKTGNLLASLTAHAFFNAINLGLIFYGDYLTQSFEKLFPHLR